MDILDHYESRRLVARLALQRHRRKYWVALVGGHQSAMALQASLFRLVAYLLPDRVDGAYTSILHRFLNQIVSLGQVRFAHPSVRPLCCPVVQMTWYLPGAVA